MAIISIYENYPALSSMCSFSLKQPHFISPLKSTIFNKGFKSQAISWPLWQRCSKDECSQTLRWAEHGRGKERRKESILLKQRVNSLNKIHVCSGSFLLLRLVLKPFLWSPIRTAFPIFCFLYDHYSPMLNTVDCRTWVPFPLACRERRQVKDLLTHILRGGRCSSVGATDLQAALVPSCGYPWALW